MNDYYQCTRLGLEGFMCGPKKIYSKSGGLKRVQHRPGAVIGWIGHVSHRLGSIFSAIELIILCAFVCRVGIRYFDAQIRKTLLYK